MNAQSMILNGAPATLAAAMALAPAPAEAQKRAERKKDIDAFNGQCAGKRYYPSDLASIQGQLPFDPAKVVAGK